MLDWKSIYFGPLKRQDIQKAIKDQTWQILRVELKGTTLKNRYEKLKKWLEVKNCSKDAQVQVTNYITALSRGGMIKPEEYL